MTMRGPDLRRQRFADELRLYAVGLPESRLAAAMRFFAAQIVFVVAFVGS